MEIAEFQKSLDITSQYLQRDYLPDISSKEILNIQEETNLRTGVRMMHIQEVTYENGENIQEKLGTVFSALSNLKNTLFLLLDSDGTKVNFYFGIKLNNHSDSISTVYRTLTNSLKGQFQGLKYESIKPSDVVDYVDALNSDTNIAVVTTIAGLKNRGLYDNEHYIQGMEKFIDSMYGQAFTGLILASSLDATDIEIQRKSYEDIYTQLSELEEYQLMYTLNKGGSTNITRGTSMTEAISKSTSYSESISQSSEDSKKRNKTTSGIQSIAIIAGTAVAATIATGGAAAAGMLLMGGVSMANSILSQASKVNDKQKSKSISNTKSKSYSFGSNESFSEGISTGESIGIQQNHKNKRISNLLKKLDLQFERLNEFETSGVWEVGAYFLADNPSAVQMAASNYKSIVTGEENYVENSAINYWFKNEKEKDNERNAIRSALVNFRHPYFNILDDGHNQISIGATSLISSKELAIHMSLPRKSIVGLPILEQTRFNREIINHENGFQEHLDLGSIYDLGSIREQKVNLNMQSLAMHTFVTGSTGSGKSNTIYNILDGLMDNGIHVLVIEPAKGEYKHVFGQKDDVFVYGTNRSYTKLLKINPFSFPKGIHVYEHIDRLIEIFNVCWSMEAAMPAFLKEAIIKAYENVGWDVDESINVIRENIFPNIQDLEESLNDVIHHSGFSDEVKGNYTGALVTRVKSLGTGINRQILTDNEVSYKDLFDRNVLIDLSRIGSSEVKSLVMGLLVIKLNEYRMSTQTSLNSKLMHVTVLEEAHVLLRASSNTYNNLTKLSVEMLSNSIAEMRTYGEGFMIVDQSPSSVDESAIKNTNTKIVLRLPDSKDREIVGKSMGMSDEQIDDLANLPVGVGGVYQNNWIGSALCKISYFESKERMFVEKDINRTKLEKEALQKVINLMLSNVTDAKSIVSDKDIGFLNCSVSTKNQLKVMLTEYETKGLLEIWSTENKFSLSQLVCKYLIKIESIEGKLQKSSGMDDLNSQLEIYIQHKIGFLNLAKKEYLKGLVIVYLTKKYPEVKLWEKWMTTRKEVVTWMN
ncbi:ATP-binding protein [Trichococcus shcherbakoviae]|uniref:ATP-binding protein n=1 Tax=Trichococcus shcherbakoviae TaxID=2094020 RepID=UPI002AA8A84D|nr:ATP-binding protein [Trichococcus shcherbakoviae]